MDDKTDHVCAYLSGPPCPSWLVVAARRVLTFSVACLALLVLVPPASIIAPAGVAYPLGWILLVAAPVGGLVAAIRLLQLSRGFVFTRGHQIGVVTSVVLSGVASVIGICLVLWIIPGFRNDLETTRATGSRVRMDTHIAKVAGAGGTLAAEEGCSYPTELAVLLERRKVQAADLRPMRGPTRELSLLAAKPALDAADRATIAEQSDLTICGKGIPPDHYFDDQLLVIVSKDVCSDHSRALGFASGRVQWIRGTDVGMALDQFNKYRKSLGLPMVH